MADQEQKKPSRLRFSEDEQTPSDEKKAEWKRKQMKNLHRKKLAPQKPEKKEEVLDADEKPVKSRLHHGEPKGKAPKQHTEGILRSTIRSQAHQKVSEQEEDNTGLKAVHSLEQSGENLHSMGKNAHASRLKHEYNKEQKAASKLMHDGKKEIPAKGKSVSGSGSNPQSRMYQRQNMKKNLSARYGKGTKKTGKAATKSTKSAGEKVFNYFRKSKHTILLIGLAAMLMFVMSTVSSCTPMFEVGVGSLTIGTYPAEKEDLLGAERWYCNKEDEQREYLENFAENHPEYQECIITADDIWHDPYALLSLVSAYLNGTEWNQYTAVPTMEMLFSWQYELTETITTETRYMEHEEYEDVWVPYEYTICTVELKNKNLSHAPVYIMNEQRVGYYAMYMSTLGNQPGLFTGPHASVMKEPLEYDVPQELLDADPKFALLVEEANKRLGYPYVWGGHNPTTSFDCAGFISWVFTETRVDPFGHLGANGIYDRCRKIAPEDAKPGDVIFFQGTIAGEEGITHCGLYVGNNMMIHCGNPCSYADLSEAYWQQHFYGYGRLYEH